MREDTLNKLYAPFDEVKTKPGKGQYKYIKSRDIIDRMNRVFEGNWSSDVVRSEITEDNVLVCARVYVKDNGDTFYHDGYGSSQIARFTFGDKKGQAINIGNNYNSAKSLAIKDAVKKWGVALYIEDSPDEEAGNVGIDLSSIPEVKSAADLSDTVPIGDKIPDAPQIYKSTQPMVDTVQTFPSTVVSKTVEKVPEFTPPSFPSVPGIVEDTDHTPPHGNITPLTSSVNVTQEVDIDKITDVQKVAIQGLLQLKGLDYKELLINALGRTDNLPARSEGLTYQEAVTVIKYGNDVDRK